jgi:1-acyl-sn-glycerol-3-phosphate acyltransferase
MNKKLETSERTPSARLSPTRRNFWWFTSQMFARPLFTAWFRVRARGLEHIPRQGGALLLINHQSFLDPMMAAAAISRPVSYLGRDSLFRVPGVGWWLRHIYAISINRESAGAGSIRAAVERLKQGFLVGIFPEGTRSSDGTLGPLKPGFIALVRRARVPVIPVGLAGTGAALPRNAWFVRPRTCRVVYGDPLPPEEIESYSRGRDEELVALIRERMLHCCTEAEAWRLGSDGTTRMEHERCKLDNGDTSMSNRAAEQ